jgi:hypothetical protein
MKAEMGGVARKLYGRLTGPKTTRCLCHRLNLVWLKYDEIDFPITQQEQPLEISPV